MRSTKLSIRKKYALLLDEGTDQLGEKARKQFLHTHPLCVECQKEGRYVKATVVDHVVPHRGDADLFWDRSNWQPLCKHHHDVKTGTLDMHPKYRY